MASKPITLGEALSGKFSRTSGLNAVARIWFSLIKLLSFGLLAGILALSLEMFLGWPDLDKIPFFILLTALVIVWWFVNRADRGNKPHFLLSNDRQGFMHGLPLDEKTIVLDGSNIY